MLKRIKVLQMTLTPSHLATANAKAPHGEIHAAISLGIEDDAGIEYQREDGAAEDHFIRDQELCDRARLLFADVTQHIADEKNLPVRAAADKAAALVQPTK